MYEAPFQFDLFCSEFLPSWLPDETIYSLVGRFARLGGHNSSKTTSKLLFGHARRGYQHDFAAGLSNLSGVSRGFLGTPDEIALHHSIAPYYLAFASKTARRDVLDRMAGSRIGALKYSLGLLTSGFRANHPLKGCCECERLDRQEVGTPYWHVCHQFPTVLSCPSHGIPLWFERSKSDGAARFEWLLPDDVPGENRIRLDGGLSGRFIQLFKKLTEMSCDLAEHGRTGVLSPSRLQQAIRGRLDDLGYVTPKGSIRRKAAAACYIQHGSLLGQIPLLHGLPINNTTAAQQLDRLLRCNAGFTHPIRNLSVLTWLWPSWSDFWASYEEERRSRSDTIEIESPDNTESADLRDLLVASVQSGRSVTASARSLGISVAMAQRLAATEGLRIQRRPKALSPSARGTIRELARIGLSKHEIAAAVGLSAQSVMRFMNTEPKLKAEWQSQRLALTRDAYRRTWVACIREAGDGGVKAVRIADPAAYAWLYRNDRDWLRESTANLSGPKSQTTRFVDWPKRDKDLSALIRSKCALGGRTGELTVPVTLGRLCEAVPELRAKLRRLDDLPVTAQTLSQVLAQ